MENNSQAIEIKGIVRNQTKIGVQDGQCDDIINLRFKDGSWRVADDGKVMLDADNGTPFNATGYSQLYVHTNVYHHLLGVKKGKLYWFANIGVDGESFTFIKNTNGVPSPVEICNVQGDVTIVQNGHLITIISLVSSDTTPLPLADSSKNEERISYAIFVTGTDEYKVLNVNANGEQTDRGLYPFGKVHLNLNCDAKEFTIEDKDGKNGLIKLDDTDIDISNSGALCPDDTNEEAERTLIAKQLWHSQMLEAFKKAQDDNSFTRPILAIVAVKLYDGSYIYTSAPVLLNPRESVSSYKNISSEFGCEEASDIYYEKEGIYIPDNLSVEYTESGFYRHYYSINRGDKCYFKKNAKENSDIYHFAPIYISGASTLETADVYIAGTNSNRDINTTKTYMKTSVYGSSLVMSIGDLRHICENDDVFKGVSIFITEEVDIYKRAANEYKEGVIKVHQDKKQATATPSSFIAYARFASVSYKPALRENEEVIYDLMHSPFYLLREYNINELKAMSNTSVEVDLSAPEYKGLLANIVNQPQLDATTLERKDFFPKNAYQYNTKLHIANYQLKQFHGYPIDCFHLSNHNVKVQKGSFLYDVLPDITNGVEYQYPRTQIQFVLQNDSDAESYYNAAIKYNTCYAYVSVTINTALKGEQKVVRYIAPYLSNFISGNDADFVESLGALLSFPDYRATSITVMVVESSAFNGITRYTASFPLIPHPYLNIAYYIDPELKPIKLPKGAGSDAISLNTFISNGGGQLFTPPAESNNIENFPNGLKVSLANNPFFFPYETTYQVGSSEIVALMSNSVAVGTGQTGAAPLYVFCKDGIFALMVDSSGEMTYTNARIIARDVCNNAKSVTPIDNGVVFTTDRGIMSIAGNEVIEIGSAAEGDVFDIADAADKAKKIMFNAFTMPQLAEFPEGLIGNTDFLTYIKGAIVNYNHNERELMVSNPDKDYTYVMDRNGNWSRRAFAAQEYVNNYPTSYRIDKEGKFYKVDTDDNDTNKIYLLSNVIKLGTIAFKQAYRLIVRGYFETYSAAYGKINGVPVKVVGSFIDRMKAGEGLQMAYITQYGQQMWVDVDNNNYVLNGQIQILDPATNEDITYSVVSVNSGQYYRVVKSYEKVGCYVFGSYDGRQWSLLGGNEKGGKFTDIGCKIAHTDIRYLRVCLAGKLSKDTRIDYIEVSADGSALNGKLR